MTAKFSREKTKIHFIWIHPQKNKAIAPKQTGYHFKSPFLSIFDPSETKYKMDFGTILSHKDENIRMNGTSSSAPRKLLLAAPQLDGISLPTSMH